VKRTSLNLYFTLSVPKCRSLVTDLVHGIITKEPVIRFMLF